MGFTVIDRRKSGKGKSTDNRRKFLRRVKRQVRDAVRDTIMDGKVTDIVDGKSKKVYIPGKGLGKPSFRHDKDGGIKDYVQPGNKDFNQGDRHDRPQEGGGGGGGGEGSPDGEGNDEFGFELSKEEFLDMFFEDLELPDMMKKDIVKTDEFENRRAGFSVDGNPSRLNILQSMKRAKGRRLGLRSPNKKKLKALLAELASIELTDETQPRVEELNDLINKLKRKIKAVPFLDDMDLRYNRWEKVPVPTTQAVMFGIMDVSASMGQWEKEMAKRFFMLMLLFLHYNYERVDIVWIRHHTRAIEVDEQEFFHSKETGGTIVSSALHIMKDVIADRYPLTQWNIFGCQISDGDNWQSDNANVLELMQQSIVPQSQYFAYVEVNQHGGSRASDLWPVYESLRDSSKNVAMAMVTDVTEIYPIFRQLFEKRET